MAEQTNTLVEWNRNVHFPELSDQAIQRPHQLHAIVDALSVEAPALFLEGEPLDGATWALAQFCLLKPDQTFSLFITPASKLTYSVDYLRTVLAEQFSHCLNGTGLPGEIITKSVHDDLFLKVMRRFRKRPMYFVIDGLHQIPEEDSSVVTQIFSDVLQFGFSPCRFIITGKEEKLRHYLPKNVRSKYFQLHRFSLGETRQFLESELPAEGDCQRIYALCRNGSPGLLAVVKRLLQGGANVEDLLGSRSDKYLDFIRLEFDPLLQMPPTHQLVAAILAFSKFQPTLTDLASMCEISTDDVLAVVAGCTFLKLSDGDRIEYVSETHRSHAGRRLERLRMQAHERQLRHLESRPDSDVALQFLPMYLETLNRRQQLVDLLKRPDHYGNLLERTQSFSTLKDQAELAAKSALQMEHFNEVFRFSLLRSIFASAGTSGGDPSRVRALVALGKTDAAVALASTEKTKEDRLALLCTYARLYSERHGKPDAELIAYIGKLIEAIDFSSMGDQALRIAADVLIFDTDAAIGIIEATVRGEAAAVRDASFVQLSLTASLGRGPNAAKDDEKVRSRISDEALQRVAHSFDLLARQHDVESLHPFLAKMPAAHQIHFLRTFVSIKRQDPNILDLVDLGLDTIIKEPAYTPRARDLAELCAPFVNPCTDTARLKGLVNRIDGQVGLVARSALSRDLVRLQMRLAAGQYQYDRVGARERIATAYYSTIEVRTPEVRMECLAVMLGAIAKIDVDGELESKDGLRELIRSDLDVVVNEMLAGSGDHLGVVLPVLKVLAADDCSHALRLAERLNTVSRRDVAYENIARVLLGRPFTAARLTALRTALQRITTDDHRSKAVVSLLGSLDSNSDKCAWLSNLDDLRSYCVRGFELSAWDCWMYRESLVCGVDYGVELFKERALEATNRQASVHEHASLHFNAAEALARTDSDSAQTFYAEGLRISQGHPLATPTRTRLFERCLSLIGRAMASLARTQSFDGEQLTRYLALVERLPGSVVKVNVLSEFAERMWCAKRADLLERVVNQSLRPQLEMANSAHPSVGRLALGIALPALCATHQKLALERVSQLPAEDADSALYEAVNLKIRHLPAKEPNAPVKADLSKARAEDILDAIELTERMSTDGSIYVSIRLITDAITDTRNRSKFTSTQKADWSARLLDIVEEKLPDGQNIQHNGYVIVCKAAIFTLSDHQWTSWRNLIDAVDEVPNIADQAFILTVLAVLLPKKFNSHKKSLLERAGQVIDSIPSPLDRLSHLQTLAQDVHAADSATSVKETLKAAMKLSLTLDHEAKVSQNRRELIDLAYQVEPALADELVEMVDDDPARVALKSEAKRASELAKTKRAVANACAKSDAEQCDLELLPAAAWRNLGALLSSRLEPKAPEVMLQFVEKVADETLDQAYPVLSWHLANLERKYQSESDVRAHLVPHCEAVLLATELTESLLRRVAGAPPDAAEDTPDQGLVVRRHTRDEALQYMRAWLQRNAGEEIVFCDPYFSPEDVEFLRTCLAAAPESTVRVLAEKRNLQKLDALGPEPFLEAWNQQSDQDPPNTEIIGLAVDGPVAKGVIHDRWLLTGESGLRLGTSFGSMGEDKLSEISVLEPERAKDLQTSLNQYLRRVKVVDGVKIHYMAFTL